MFIAVTGTNTDVGKTIATAALACQLRERGWQVAVAKPIQTGEDDDAGVVAELAGVEVHRWRCYPEPLAPNLSARRAGQPYPELGECARFLQTLDGPGRVVLVEGAGGLLVRLGQRWTLADLAAQLRAGLIVVTSLGLGSLNSAELTVEAARRRGLEVKGLIGGSLPAAPDLATSLNIEELPEVTGVPLLGCLPAGLGQRPRSEFLSAVGGLDWVEVD